MTPEKCCGTCAHFRLPADPPIWLGSRCGSCHWSAPQLPDSVSTCIPDPEDRGLVREDKGDDCPCYTKKETPNNDGRPV